MPHFDWSFNVANVCTIAAAAATLLWKASQFVTEMKQFRERYEAYVVENEERFERIEARLEGRLAFAKKS